MCSSDLIVTINNQPQILFGFWQIIVMPLAFLDTGSYDLCTREHLTHTLRFCLSNRNQNIQSFTINFLSIEASIILITPFTLITFLATFKKLPKMGCFYKIIDTTNLAKTPQNCENELYCHSFIAKIIDHNITTLIFL